MIPAFMMSDTVTVETFLGAGPYGDAYAEPVEVACKHEGKRQLVRGKYGDEVEANSSIVVDPEHSGLFEVDSRVNFHGTIAYVVAISIHTGWFGGFLDHTEVALR